MSETLSVAINSRPEQRQVYFYLTSDGIVPNITQSGGQPTISVNSGVYTSNGVSTLTHLNSGHYVAQLSSPVSMGWYVGDVLHSRYSAVGVVETEGSTVEIVRPWTSDVSRTAATGMLNPVSQSGQILRRNVYVFGHKTHN